MQNYEGDRQEERVCMVAQRKIKRKHKNRINVSLVCEVEWSLVLSCYVRWRVGGRVEHLVCASVCTLCACVDGLDVCVCECVFAASIK